VIIEYCYFVRGLEYAHQAITAIESVRRADPKAHVLVVTDDPALDGIPGTPTAMLKIWERIEPVQLAKASALAKVAMTSRADRLVFLDTDTIVQRSVREWPQADLYLTWRDHVAVDEKGNKVVGVADVMPYNGGVYGITPQSAGVEAMIWLRENIARQPVDRHRWNGDQYAMHALAGAPPKDGWRLADVTLDWAPNRTGPPVRICSVPCDEWNYTPPDGADTSKAGILHFKGHSRARFLITARELGLPVVAA
jgi:hypothetical protein